MVGGVLMMLGMYEEVVKNVADICGGETEMRFLGVK